MLNLEIKPGQIVVITGVNGYIGSNVANEFLLRGYTVRGTVRDTTRCAWLADHFAARYGPDRFSLVQVVDLGDEASYAPALRSASALLITTSAVDFQQTDPAASIPPAVQQTLAPLAAAAREPSIKAVVLTGSAWAVSTPGHDDDDDDDEDESEEKEGDSPSSSSSSSPSPPSSPSSTTSSSTSRTLDQFTWNTAALHAAHTPTFTNPTARARAVYMATLVEKERRAWSWTRTHNPPFRFNVVLVATAFGAILSPAHQGTPSSTRFAAALLKGERGAAGRAREMVRPQWFVDVADAARVHVAVAVKADVAGERVFAFGGVFGSNDVLRVLRGIFPERGLVGDDEGEGACRTRVMNRRGEGLLREMGREGWTGLEVSVRRLVESARPVLAV